MKILLNLEHAGILVLAIFILLSINTNLLLLAVTFFSPDIAIAAYLINKKIGAYVYNVFHHMGLAAVLTVIGYLLNSNEVIYFGWIMIAHSSFDRVLGYGLKYSDNFKHTHLGYIK